MIKKRHAAAKARLTMFVESLICLSISVKSIFVYSSLHSLMACKFKIFIIPLFLVVKDSLAFDARMIRNMLEITCMRMTVTSGNIQIGRMQQSWNFFRRRVKQLQVSTKNTMTVRNRVESNYSATSSTSKLKALTICDLVTGSWFV